MISNSQADFDTVYQQILAGWGAQTVRTLACLSVAEALASGPLSAEEIAERASSDPDMTYRLLRAGAALGFLRYDETDKEFSGTPMLQVLHEDSQYCLKHYAMAGLSAAFWLPALQLPDTVIRGENFVSDVLGCSTFEYLSTHDEEAQMFGAAMTDLSTPVIRHAVAAIDVADARLVVDVGGANGAFLAQLLKLHPPLTGVVLDLPSAMHGVEQEARRHGVGDRMTGVEGDFFDEIPAADLYLLKFVLHDWDDQACQTILRNIRRAMKPGARLMIAEMTIAQNLPSAALMDIAMMFAFSGRERETGEFEQLLKAADLKMIRDTPLQPPYHLIEASPA
ncbi:methyltransferase [Mycobacterium montefiorense]|uniref:O-methyltransferase n=1 Tax=Mycobacterium montefiorense TaxID=154654 RepID=A0AA37UUU8_9MYCO|nr:methyltransferase [Mycobacterium montefiorense]GBG38742.1 O-methyltransferase [Mycobacterium montefiorense]GKU34571.1 O-methyltransferase [Mycobacterium montefiorense]GKU39192.1 O-methyltransferase [Mycobacterium montefiorense]GKU43617.1 O-methyltransferase [Mycobacterium montefiorense]GKU49957.1 O-methyltransferase [Mycobacterium montefiorense]